MSENVTEREIAAYKEAFSVFDKNGDGTVDMNELGTVMRTLGVYPSDQQLQEMINDADKDGNGCVDFTEFLCMISKTKSDLEDNTEKEIYDAFCVFDKDDSGFITDDELRMVLESLGKESVTPEDVEEFLSGVDIDGDGRINYNEFYKMMTKNKS